MLKIDALTHAHLIKLGALTTDPDGNEHLIGLSLHESAFVIAYQQQTDATTLAVQKATFLQLERKHLLARANAALSWWLPEYTDLTSKKPK